MSEITSSDTQPMMTAPKTSAHSEAQSYVLFHLGEKLYAINSAAVREITRWRAATPVPGAPDTLSGIISQRGAIMPVVDLHRLLGFPTHTPGRATRYIIAQHDTIELALIVESVSDLIDISPDDQTPPPDTLPPQYARLLRAISCPANVNQSVALLDLASIIEAIRSGA